MSNVTLGKGGMTAFQRWEMNSFDQAPAKPEPTVATSNELTAPPPPAISPEEIARIKEEARLDGYATGYQEGFLAGEQEGKSLALHEGKQQTQEHLDVLEQLCANFRAQLDQADTLIAQDLLDLATDLARAMFKHHIEQQPELLLPVLQDALHQLPYMQQAAKLIVHPDDADIVTERLGQQLEKTGWRVIADAQIERGGCKLETPQNLVDASVSTRWERLLETVRKRS